MCFRHAFFSPDDNGEQWGSFAQLISDLRQSHIERTALSHLVAMIFAFFFLVVCDWFFAVILWFSLGLRPFLNTPHLFCFVSYLFNQPTRITWPMSPDSGERMRVPVNFVQFLFLWFVKVLGWSLSSFRDQFSFSKAYFSFDFLLAWCRPVFRSFLSLVLHMKLLFYRITLVSYKTGF